MKMVKVEKSNDWYDYIELLENLAFSRNFKLFGNLKIFFFTFFMNFCTVQADGKINALTNNTALPFNQFNSRRPFPFCTIFSQKNIGPSTFMLYILHCNKKLLVYDYYLHRRFLISYWEQRQLICNYIPICTKH